MTPTNLQLPPARVAEPACPCGTGPGGLATSNLQSLTSNLQLPHQQEGFVVWFTGLSGSGKTTLAKLLEQELQARGLRVERLDGDVVRQSLTADLGFSKADRDKNIQRVTFVAKLLSRNGVGVLAAFISPYRAIRDWVRGEVTNFIEVFVDCPLEECMRRDVKGLYIKAMAGEIPEFTGVSDPYEPPLNPEITVNTAEESAPESFAKIMGYLEAKGHLPAQEVVG